MTLGLLLAMATLGADQPPIAEESTELGRSILARQRAPWYDSERDDARPVRLQPIKTLDIPEFGDSGASIGWFSFSKAASFALWALLGIVVGVVLYYLFAHWRIPHRGADDKSSAKRGGARHVDRIEELPVELRNVADFLAEANRSIARGDLARAIVCYYAFALLTLDRAGVVKLDKAKTNRRYLREVQKRAPALTPLMIEVVEMFEGSFFGGIVPRRDRFDRLWAQRDRLQRVEEAP